MALWPDNSKYPLGVHVLPKELDEEVRRASSPDPLAVLLTLSLVHRSPALTSRASTSACACPALVETVEVVH